jgi:6-pyruvoyl-tetrahydropterin synthase
MKYWLFLIFTVEGPGTGLILNYMHICKILWKFKSFQDASNLNRAEPSQPSHAPAGVTRETAVYLAKVLWPTLQLQLHDSATFRGWRHNLDLKSSPYQPFLKLTVTAFKYTRILISNLSVDTNIGIIIIIITKTEDFEMLD